MVFFLPSHSEQWADILREARNTTEALSLGCFVFFSPQVLPGTQAGNLRGSVETLDWRPQIRALSQPDLVLWPAHEPLLGQSLLLCSWTHRPLEAHQFSESTEGAVEQGRSRGSRVRVFDSGEKREEPSSMWELLLGSGVGKAAKSLDFPRGLMVGAVQKEVVVLVPGCA